MRENLTYMYSSFSRYYFSLIGSNGFGAQAELAVDDLSLSPQCFGLGVSTEAVGTWRYNMTDLELCQYYGKRKIILYQAHLPHPIYTCNFRVAVCFRRAYLGLPNTHLNERNIIQKSCTRRYRNVLKFNKLFQ